MDKQFNFIGLVGGFLCFLAGIAWLAYDYIYNTKTRSVVGNGVKGVYAGNKHKFQQNDFNDVNASVYSLQSMGGDDNKQVDYKPPNLEEDSIV